MPDLDKIKLVMRGTHVSNSQCASNHTILVRPSTLAMPLMYE